jgi:hypothetical protein
MSKLREKGDIWADFADAESQRKKTPAQAGV